MKCEVCDDLGIVGVEGCNMVSDCWRGCPMVIRGQQWVFDGCQWNHQDLALLHTGQHWICFRKTGIEGKGSTATKALDALLLMSYR